MANQHFQAQPIRDLICADFSNFNPSDMDLTYSVRSLFADYSGIPADGLIIPDGGKPKNLVQGLAEQIARVTEIRTSYLALPKNAGAPAAALMEQAINAAIDAQASGDIMMMIVCFNELKEFQL